MNLDPAMLAQMDREKALWDDKLNELITAHKDLTDADSSVAVFQLMSALSELPPWKIMAVLACAVERICAQ